MGGWIGGEVRSIALSSSPGLGAPTGVRGRGAGGVEVEDLEHRQLHAKYCFDMIQFWRRSNPM